MKTSSYIIFAIPAVVLILALGCIAYIVSGREPAVKEITLGGEPTTMRLAEARPHVLDLSVFEDELYKREVDTLMVNITVDNTLTAPVIEADSALLKHMKASCAADTLGLTFALDRKQLTKSQYESLNEIRIPSAVNIRMPALPAIIVAGKGASTVKIDGCRADYLEFRSKGSQWLNLDSCAIETLVLNRADGNGRLKAALVNSSSVTFLNLAQNRAEYIEVDGDYDSFVQFVNIEPTPVADDVKDISEGSVCVDLGTLRFKELTNRHYAPVQITYGRQFRADFSVE